MKWLWFLTIASFALGIAERTLTPGHIAGFVRDPSRRVAPDLAARKNVRDFMARGKSPNKHPLFWNW
jgi:hypothetical protein